MITVFAVSGLNLDFFQMTFQYPRHLRSDQEEMENEDKLSLWQNLTLFECFTFVRCVIFVDKNTTLELM